MPPPSQASSGLVQPMQAAQQRPAQQYGGAKGQLQQPKRALTIV
jgi:hypothetical protein